jgi:hypothetical protein
VVIYTAPGTQPRADPSLAVWAWARPRITRPQAYGTWSRIDDARRELLAQIDRLALGMRPPRRQLVRHYRPKVLAWIKTIARKVSRLTRSIARKACKANQRVVRPSSWRT